MRRFSLIAATGVALLALAGCEQNTTVPEAETTETMVADPAMPAGDSTTIVTQPGPTETVTSTATVPTDSPDATVTLGATPSATLTAN